VNTLNIVLLARTKGEAPLNDGEYPEYLSECDGQPLIQSLIDNCASLDPGKILCMFPNSEIASLHLRNMVQQMHPAARVLPVHDATRGAACTALLATEHIDNDEELLILSTSDVLDIALSQVVRTFRDNGDDAGIVIFKSLHPRYSFARLDDAGRVVEVAEKNPISPHAIAGMYWFKSGSTFVSAAKDMIRKDARVNNRFFISPSLNELVLQHKKIGAYRIEPTQYRPLKTHSQVQAFETGVVR
jgi:dTDP-glucose pyrophosphorylase